EDALKRYAAVITWPRHLLHKYPNPNEDIHTAIAEVFGWGKANWVAADFLAQGSEAEIPEWLRQKAAELKELCDPQAAADGDAENGGDAGPDLIVAAADDDGAD